ncbi:hypothetical protein I7I48_12123 [Histoplasma ohiense]|nr:hypothetical protein I7I48_12123 [Histoplasma ohiense (nom. inval.)]
MNLSRMVSEFHLITRYLCRLIQDAHTYYTRSTGIFRLLNMLVEGTVGNDAKSPTREKSSCYLSEAFAGANIKININIRTTDFNHFFFFFFFFLHLCLERRKKNLEK